MKDKYRFSDEIDQTPESYLMKDFSYFTKQPLSLEVWKDKYRFSDEVDLKQTIRRVATAILCDEKLAVQERITNLMLQGIIVPAGRILAGAGTNKRVTLNNCYVADTIEDSIKGIMKANTDTALTLQQGGGDGLAFGTIRPKKALLRTTGDGAQASGPIPFIRMVNATCETIMSAGQRRGALMGTITDTHPDVEAFIDVKHTAGSMTNFNLSILVSDAFMQAVKDNADWHLYFNVPPADAPQSPKFQFEGSDEWQYVYKTLKARDLWKKIMESTYEYSEPGIIFIDRVNNRNNLRYCEHIQATNPCGEQPLPPNAACNLSAINLAVLVVRPFTPYATFDYQKFGEAVEGGVIFLDNIIDKTGYPLEEQKKEQIAKRRIGLGITGLGDCLAMLKMPYDSEEAIEFVDNLMEKMANRAYSTSAKLAKEKGPFPLCLPKGKMAQYIGLNLEDSTIAEINKYGLRNGVLLTVAPTGTTSCVYGNVSGGLEPIFANVSIRKVLQADDSYKEYVSLTYAGQVAQTLGKLPSSEILEGMIEKGNKENNLKEVMQEINALFPQHMRDSEAMKLHPFAHLRMQATIQKWIDASVSKTINISEDAPFEDMEEVYLEAYKLGCKGTTTYRPSKVRGSILKTVTQDVKTPKAKKRIRPEMLHGVTYKIPWPSLTSAVFVTINDHDDKPFEIFISSKDARHQDWASALTVMVSTIFRTSEDIQFVPDELMQIQSMNDAGWLNGKFYGSLIAYIGEVIDRHLKKEAVPQPIKARGEKCVHCRQFTLIKSEGCDKCLSCGYSRCG